MKDFVVFIAGLLQDLPMKHLALMMAIFCLGTVGAMYHPFWALWLYYLLAVLRPQFLWRWALPVEWRWSLFAAIIVFVSLLVNLPRLAARGRFNLISGLILAYSVWLGLSVLTAFNPAVAESWGIEVAKIMLIALIASVVLDRFWQVKVLAVTILIALGYIAWEVNAMYLLQGRLTIYRDGFGGLDNNGAGLMLAMGIPFAYAFAISAPRQWQRVICWVIGLLMLHAVLMSYSRGAMLSLGIVLVWMLWRHRSKLQAGLITAALCLALSMLAGPEIRERFFSIAEYQRDGSAQSRFDSWAAAWTIAWDHPLTGKGIRNSNTYSHNYGADKFSRTIHSQYLQVAADSGIPAMALFIAIMATALAYLSRSRRLCGKKLRPPDGPLELSTDAEQQLLLAEHIVLACQGSLMIFVIGGAFLSLEAFELPWLLVVIAGVLPRALEAEFPETDIPLENSGPLPHPSRLYARPKPPLPSRTAHAPQGEPQRPLAEGLVHS